MNIKPYIPSILSGVSTGFMISGTVFAVKGTIKSCKEYNDLKNDVAYDNKLYLTNKELVKLYWKNYIPTILCYCAAGCAGYFSHYYEQKNIMKLTSALGIAETAFSIYKDKAKELLGEEKENEIRKNTEEEICKKQIKNDKFDHPLDDDELLFYDTYSHRTFISTSKNIEAAVVKANTNMYDCGEASINDIYRYIRSDDLDEIPLGSDVGFDIDDGIIHLRLVPMWEDEDKTSTIIFMSFDREPKILRH